MHYKDSATQTDPAGRRGKYYKDSAIQTDPAGPRGAGFKPGKTWTDDDNGRPAHEMARKKGEQKRTAVCEPPPEPDNMSPTLADIDDPNRETDSNHGGASSHTLSVGGWNADASEKAGNDGTSVVRGCDTTSRDHDENYGGLLLKSIKCLGGTEHHSTGWGDEAADKAERFHVHVLESEDHSAAGAAGKSIAAKSQEPSPDHENDQEPSDEQRSMAMDIKTQEVEESSAVKSPGDIERKAGGKKKNKKKKKKKKSKSTGETVEERAERLKQLLRQRLKMAELLEVEAQCLRCLRNAFIDLIQTQDRIQATSPKEWRGMFQGEPRSSQRFKSTFIQIYSQLSSLLKIQDRFLQVRDTTDPSGQLDVLTKLENCMWDIQFSHHGTNADKEEDVIEDMLKMKEQFAGLLAENACAVRFRVHEWVWSTLAAQRFRLENPEVPWASNDIWLGDKTIKNMWAQAMVFAFKEGWELNVKE